MFTLSVCVSVSYSNWSNRSDPESAIDYVEYIIIMKKNKDLCASFGVICLQFFFNSLCKKKWILFMKCVDSNEYIQYIWNKRTKNYFMCDASFKRIWTKVICVCQKI